MNRLALLGGDPVRTAPFPAWPIYGPEEQEQLLDIVREASWGIGKRVGKIGRFEEEFAAYHGRQHAIACSNCTHALEVMLAVAGVRAGDEVIVPAYTFIATASAVTRVGAVPVFADIDPRTLTLDPASVESLIGPRTRAVVAVHFAGYFGHIERLRDLAGERRLLLIEDAAQAHGGRWNGAAAGTFGVAAAFSFQYSKNMTAGEGGIIVADDRTVSDACWEYIWHGRRRGGLWYEHFQATSNFRMTEWQAAVLLAQLGRLPEQAERRHRNGERLDQAIGAVDGFDPLAVDVRMRPHPRHLYIVRFSPSAFAGVPKQTIVEALKAEGIPVMPGYGFPLYRNPAFRDRAFGWAGCDVNKTIDYSQTYQPESERACEESLWLLHSVLLGSDADMDDVVRAFEKVAHHRAALREHASTGPLQPQ